MSSSAHSNDPSTLAQDPNGVAATLSPNLGEPAREAVRAGSGRSSLSGTVTSEKNGVPEGMKKDGPKDTEDDAQDEDVIVVGWDGPDDPANPRKCVLCSPLV